MNEIESQMKALFKAAKKNFAAKCHRFNAKGVKLVNIGWSLNETLYIVKTLGMPDGVAVKHREMKTMMSAADRDAFLEPLTGFLVA